MAEINKKIKRMNRDYKKELIRFEKDLQSIDSFYYKIILKLISNEEYEKALFIASKSPHSIFRIGVTNLIIGKSGRPDLKQIACADKSMLLKFKKYNKKFNMTQKRWGRFSVKYNNFFYNLTKKNIKDIMLALFYASQATDDGMVLKMCLRFLAQNHPNAEFYSLKPR